MSDRKKAVKSAMEAIIEKQRQKELNKPIKPGQVRTSYLNKETK